MPACTPNSNNALLGTSDYSRAETIEASINLEFCGHGGNRRKTSRISSRAKTVRSCEVRRKHYGRWVRCFNVIVNTKSSEMDQPTLDIIPATPRRTLAQSLTKLIETKDAVESVINEKAVGPDPLQVELLELTRKKIDPPAKNTEGSPVCHMSVLLEVALNSLSGYC